MPLGGGVTGPRQLAACSVCSAVCGAAVWPCRTHYCQWGSVPCRWACQCPGGGALVDHQRRVCAGAAGGRRGRVSGGSGAAGALHGPTATGLATLAYALPLARLALARLQVMLDMGVGDGRGAESPTALGRALLTTLYLAREVSEAQRRAVVLLLSYTPLGYLVLQRN